MNALATSALSLSAFFLLFFTVSAFLCATVVSAANTQDTCLTGGQGISLTFEGQHDKLVPGFYLPGFDILNSSTYPVACQPTLLCAAERVQGVACKERQGLFEPLICPAGKYCPVPNISVPLQCPEGYYCLAGTQSPTACSSLSICPAGSDRELYLGSLILVVIFIAVLVAAVVSYTRRHLPAPSSYPSAKMHKDERKRVLQRGIQRARVETGLEQALTIEFDNLNVTLKNTSDDSNNKNNDNDDNAGKGKQQRSGDNVTKTRVNNSSNNNKERVIVRGVTGHALPGTVTALLGRSGSGKTTITNAILHKLNPDCFRVTGHLAFNGDTSTEAFERIRSSIQTVPQDDVLNEDLTIEQNIFYASELHLPRNWSDDEREEYRDVVISLLGLSKHRHTLTALASGGQRKRTSIACALAAAPACIVLDEPTSGLPGHTALELVQQLKQLAVVGKLTVLAIVHQPRLELWQTLDRVLLLAEGGRTVFEGPAREALGALSEWIPSSGYEAAAPATPGASTVRRAECGCVVEENEADIIMDAIARHGAEMADRWQQMEEQQRERKTGTKTSKPASTTAPSKVVVNVGSTNSNKTDKNDENDDQQEQQQQQHQQPAESPSTGNDDTAISMRQASFLRQVVLQHNLCLSKTLQNYKYLLLEFAILLALGSMLGFAAEDVVPAAIYRDTYSRISPQFSRSWLFMISSFSQLSASLAAAVAGVKVFGEGKPLFLRDAEAQLSMTAYFLGVQIASFWRVIIASTLFSALLHLFSRLPMPYFSSFWFPYVIMYSAVTQLSVFVSLLTRLEYSNVVSSVVSVLIGLMAALMTSLPKGLMQLSYVYWVVQLQHRALFGQVEHVSSPPYDEWKYDSKVTLGETYGVIIAMNIVIALASYAVLRYMTKGH